MDKVRKFLLKLTEKERKILQEIMRDVVVLSLKNYDIKPLKGYKDLFRLRKGSIRIVFTKRNDRGIILDIDYRKDIYSKLY
jgi:mRNA-degrading endonuclease RelE of RelBE toxin-antitoxin system